MTGAVVVAALLAVAAVLVWPRPGAGVAGGRGVVAGRGVAVRAPGDGWQVSAGPSSRRSGRSVGRRSGRSTRPGLLGGVAAALAADPVDLVRSLRRPRGPTAGDVADLVEALVPVLRAGVDPAGALRRVRGVVDLGGLAPLVDAGTREAASGGSVGRIWLQAADDLGLPALHLLGRAWVLSEQVGTSLAEALALVAGQVRRAEARDRTLAAAAAGPRSAMALLVALPLAGPLLGLAFGLDPVALYTGSAATAGCFVAAVVLVALGWSWCRRMLRRATRPEVVR